MRETQETLWTKTVLDKVNQELPDKLYANVEVELLYRSEVKKYSNEWKNSILNEKNSRFSIDLLIYEKNDDGYYIPRVAIESKFGGINTHSVITYSHKAVQHKYVTPFLRYGIMLGKMSNLPLRLLKHGEHFDFMFCFKDNSLSDNKEWNNFITLILQEVEISRKLERLWYGKDKCLIFRKKLELDID